MVLGLARALANGTGGDYGVKDGVTRLPPTDVMTGDPAGSSRWCPRTTRGTPVGADRRSLARSPVDGRRRRRRRLAPTRPRRPRARGRRDGAADPAAHAGKGGAMEGALDGCRRPTSGCSPTRIWGRAPRASRRCSTSSWRAGGPRRRDVPAAGGRRHWARCDGSPRRAIALLSRVRGRAAALGPARRSRGECLAAAGRSRGGFGVETAMTIDAVRAGLRVLEVPAPGLTHRATGRRPRGFAHGAGRGRTSRGAAAVRAVGCGEGPDGCTWRTSGAGASRGCSASARARGVGPPV